MGVWTVSFGCWRWIGFCKQKGDDECEEEGRKTRMNERKDGGQRTKEGERKKGKERERKCVCVCMCVCE
jgi:hypothetical protein